MPVLVEIFSVPGCSRCAAAQDTLRQLAQAAGPDRIQWRAVDVVAELDYAVSLGVLSIPAIAISGKLVFTGAPSAKALQQAIRQRLHDTHGSADASFRETVNRD